MVALGATVTEVGAVEGKMGTTIGEITDGKTPSAIIPSQCMHQDYLKNRRVFVSMDRSISSKTTDRNELDGVAQRHKSRVH